jgi:hypothetical protein
MTFRALLSIFPQEGSGGCTPSPRKLNADSSKMAVESDKEIWTIKGAVMLGMRWCLRI